jgi:hypothetical protein
MQVFFQKNLINHLQKSQVQTKFVPATVGSPKGTRFKNSGKIVVE